MVVAGSNLIIDDDLVRGYATVSPPPGAMTDEHLSLVEQSIALLHQVSWEEQQRRREMETVMEWKIAAERSAREIDHQQIAEKLEKAQTGGLGKASAGLIWAGVGTILGAASDELSRCSG
jgi:hypothetical protein